MAHTTPEAAERLLALSREANWAFPTSFSSSNLVRPGEGEWLERLALERDAFGQAVRFFMETGNEDAAAELVANVWRLWMMSGDIAGGRALLAAVLDAGECKPSRGRGLALYGDSLLAFKQGDFDASRERNEEALKIGQELGDREVRTLALLGLSRVALNDGDQDRARSLAEESHARARELDPSMWQAPLHMLAQATRLGGDFDEAAALFEESLALNRRLGDRVMVTVELHNLGHVEIRRGNADAAERLFAEAEAMSSSDDPYDAAMTDLNRASVAFARGDREAATALLGRVQSMVDEAKLDLAPDDLAELDWLRDRLTPQA